jgi:RNA polymerase sigma factor (sigma-70 family)
MKLLKGGGRFSSDAGLVEAARRGDVVSLGLLPERYRAPLYGLALRILGYGPEAQVARGAAQRVPHEVAGGAGRAPLRRAGSLRRPKTPESSAEETIDRLAMREWVWTALARLPETLRVTAMLRYFGSYSSYEEISAILGVPVGTVRSRLSYSGAKLERVVLADGSTLVVKRISQEYDLAMKLTHDTGRAAQLWVSGVLDRLPPVIDHAILAGIMVALYGLAEAGGALIAGRVINGPLSSYLSLA